MGCHDQILRGLRGDGFCTERKQATLQGWPAETGPGMPGEVRPGSSAFGASLDLRRSYRSISCTSSLSRTDKDRCGPAHYFR